MYYCVYEKTADGDERFVRTCETFEDAIVVIRNLYEEDYHDGALKYYFIKIVSGGNPRAFRPWEEPPIGHYP